MLYTTLCTHTLKRVAIALAAAMVLPVALATAADFGGYRPHYQGFGATSVGGRGGVVCAVNTLADNTTGAAVGGAGNPDYRGSFRYCMTTLSAAARIVVFETSGTIALTSELLPKSYTTVAGQTAPSPGITIKAAWGIKMVAVHDLVWQHLRLRMGWHNSIGAGLIVFWMDNGTYNVVADHLSISWGCDLLLATTAANGQGVRDLLITHSLFSEPLLSNTCRPSQAAFAQGALFAFSANGTLSYMNNVHVDSVQRNPRVDAGFRALVINNLLYHGTENGTAADTVQTFMFICGTGSAGTPCNGLNTPYEVVAIGNIGIPGPSTPANRPWLRIQGGTAGSQVYLAQNIGTGVTSASASCSASPSQWTAGIEIVNKWVPTGATLTKANVCLDVLPSWYTAFNITPLATTGDTPLSSGTSTARTYILANVGARPLNRDAVDTRVLGYITAGTGPTPITHESDVGGFPVLAENRRTVTVPANPNAVVDAVGRTVIEAWLEALARALEPSSGPEMLAPVNFRITN